MERPKKSSTKASWIAYADHLEGSDAGQVDQLRRKIAELEAAAAGARRDIAHLTRALRSQ